MGLTWLQPGDDRYPAGLAAMLGGAAPRIAVLGDVGLLRQRKVALFCSVRCPGSVILKTYDYACSLRDAGATVISGFHSPMERECLALLLRGRQPIIICPARSIEGMRLPKPWRQAMDEGRLLVLSSFPAGQNRATADLARSRNLLVAALADEVFVSHASPGGKMEQFCRQVVSWRKPLLTFDAPENAGLVALGAKPVRVQEGLLKADSPRGTWEITDKGRDILQRGTN